MQSHHTTPAVADRIVATIAGELAARPAQVAAAVALLDDGDTVPFIARYRKEATGGLDDTQLRRLEDRLGYLRELEDRRAAIRASIAEQGKLTPELEEAITAADTKQVLEDLYLPYKPKRRSKAQAAREAGLEPLADALLADRGLVPQEAAVAYVSVEKGVADVKAALDGARDILAERFAEQPAVLAAFREFLWNEGRIASKVVESKRASGEKFRDYFEHAEPIAQVPSHRALALFRGRHQGILSLSLTLGPERDQLVPHPCVARLAGIVGLADTLGDGGRPADRWLADTLRWCWRVKLLVHFESELFARLREAAEAEAIRVFAANLRDLLLGAPAGQRVVMGLDPGIRTGVKVAVVDATGKVVDTATLYPHEPRRDWEGALAALAELARRHGVQLVAIGNGTGSRETDKLVADLIRQHPDLQLKKVVVSEAGASVYSASELAAREFPELDVSLRGAVSIARRLQDPLAELVKIEPKAIGVGQYQHDVNQRGLSRGLDAVVEDCVNAVGVDVNTASAPLLARVSGLNPSVAERIVQHRDTNGAFRSRDALRQVPRMGDKTFEQAAGFLRIADGDNPLDRSAVHPEAYSVVERMIAKANRSARELIGNRDALRELRPEEFVDERFGEATVRDILSELEKPGRDPRGEFVTASFKEGIEKLSDLKPGMKLQGVVTNVANFGAFVDIGVHQDGLVHISALSDAFVKDPRAVVKAGQLVEVTVLEVDPQRKRIALTMKTGAGAPRGRREPAEGGGRAGAPAAGERHGRGGGGGGGELRKPGGGGQPYRGGQPASGGQPPSGDQPQGGQPRGRQPQRAQPQGGQPQGGLPQGGQPHGGQPHGGQPHGGQPHGGQPRGRQHQGDQRQGGQPQGGQRKPDAPRRPPAPTRPVQETALAAALARAIKR
jgi:protein Tex